MIRGCVRCWRASALMVLGVRPYRKWHGAHWRLVSLTELGIPLVIQTRRCRRRDRAGMAARQRASARHSLDGWTVALPRSPSRRRLAVYSRLGLADDPRVAVLASRLQEWQWPDGGWNCDPAPEASARVVPRESDGPLGIGRSISVPSRTAGSNRRSSVSAFLPAPPPHPVGAHGVDHQPPLAVTALSSLSAL